MQIRLFVRTKRRLEGWKISHRSQYSIIPMLHNSISIISVVASPMEKG